MTASEMKTWFENHKAASAARHERAKARLEEAVEGLQKADHKARRAQDLLVLAVEGLDMEPL